MKRLALLLGLVAFLGNCGSSAPDIKISSEMKDFMSQLKGGETIEPAIKKYAASNLVRNEDVGSYGLTKPAVLSERVEGSDTCYTIKAAAGVTERKLDTCWSGGKLTKILDLGFYTE